MSTEIERRLRSIESRQDKIVMMLETFINQLKGFGPVEKPKAPTVEDMKARLVTGQVKKHLKIKL